jgi:hypothetical protein
MGEGFNGARTRAQSLDSSGIVIVACAAEAEEAEIAVFAAPWKNEDADGTLQKTAPRRAPQPL